MPVSKRTRYEVLKRDNFTCRYCRSTDAPLRVDHVTPIALGGRDNPSNLVAACQDCNAGKSSTSPTDDMVADVREDALRHAELTRQAYKILVQRMGERDDYIEEWLDAWAGGGLPDDWQNTIGRWFEMGVPIEIVTDAAHVAFNRTYVRDNGRFAYMCGIVWNQVQMVDELAEAKRYVDGMFVSEELSDEQGQELWYRAWDAGYMRAASDLVRYDPLSTVVDKIVYPPAFGAF